ncbi:hypothetical protein [Nocardia sp. CC201C]|uniref:hypothetical protein n=1 Tax=Nocardia sp. CC201C TaxID=3044575 RepID=UPI0024A7FE53|nr:hypothetical protein [Nocardia sp. CC201C]
MSTNSSGGSRAGLALAIAGVAVVLAAAAVLFAVSRDGIDSGDGATSARPTPGTVSVAPTTAPGSGDAGSGTSQPGVSASGPAAPTTPSDPDHFAYQPLWPFATAADAADWQRAYRAGGHQPWHLDAPAVALTFTQQYLGYGSVDRVVNTQYREDEAWITVGYARPDDPGHVGLPAAVLHLVRFGSGPDAPWEVVGTEDRTLTLTTPPYGSQVGSPITVGGRISGVDESLDIQVRQLGREQPVGTVGRIPAGGTDMPWSATVPVDASCPSTLTVAVATGGHVTDVERFAVTGVRC